ncbi:LacI family DNA-binding transcriptional regulator [Uliginosibacterium gangwonense]|uniref:LacI family DNA-binding transcriptional regulator n=1 Tax=Uliginosibacterium gangwonense TaxID=392736 RepID=UPI0003611294|nr:substrate-binding domain-containing protein [Uliginosibacterium gangwonense]
MPHNSDPVEIDIPENVTLEVVARVAGVSPATVSRILNGTARVSDRKRTAVLSTIKRLNYRPNALARGLAQGRTNSIGVLTQDIASPFYGEALRGVEDALAGTGMIPLFASGHWNLQDEVERMEHLLSRRVDGVIVLTGKLSDAQILDYANTVPIVVTGRQLTGPNVISLSVDNFLGAQMATQHLIDWGHTRIAHVAGPADHIDAINRLRGYRQALEDAGIPFDPDLVAHADFHEPGGVLAINQLLASRRSFTAVFASNDQSAYGIQLALSRHGIRVPDDISVVGFDDLLVSSYMVPPLTTIRQPVNEMGVAAAKALVAMINGIAYDASLPAPELIVRASSRLLRR